MLLTQTQYAARRGVSKMAVSKAVKAGRISTTDGKIDPAVADAQWERNTRSNSGGSQPSAPVDPPRSRPQGDGPTPGSLAHAQLVHETAKAKKAGLEAQRLEGKLVDRSAVETAWAGIGVRIRDAVMGLPISVCNRVPAEWRRELATVLEDEARKVLTALSDEIRSDPRAA